MVYMLLINSSSNAKVFTIPRQRPLGATGIPKSTQSQSQKRYWIKDWLQHLSAIVYCLRNQEKLVCPKSPSMVAEKYILTTTKNDHEAIYHPWKIPAVTTPKPDRATQLRNNHHNHENRDKKIIAQFPYMQFPTSHTYVKDNCPTQTPRVLIITGGTTNILCSFALYDLHIYHPIITPRATYTINLVPDFNGRFSLFLDKKNISSYLRPLAHSLI